MKLLPLVLMCTSALADPVLLYGPWQCSGTRYCYNVPNSADATDIDIYAPHQYLNSVSVLVNGVAYSTATAGGTITVVSTNNYASSFDHLPLTSAAGNMIYLSANFTGIHRQINSGRAHWWVTYWTLQDGQIDGLVADPPPAP